MLAAESAAQSTHPSPRVTHLLPDIAFTRRVRKALRAAGNPRSWLCLLVTGYVFGLAVLNLARYGLER